LIRVTLDTNILVSAFLYSGNERKVLEAAIQGRLKSVTSPSILHELGRVLARLGVGEREVEGYLIGIMEVSEVSPPMRLGDVEIRDREDVKILECAHSGETEYIVTGDEDLLSLGEYEGIKMVRSWEMLRLLQNV
jgi:uncharacterized protein